LGGKFEVAARKGNGLAKFPLYWRSHRGERKAAGKRTNLDSKEEGKSQEG